MYKRCLLLIADLYKVLKYWILFPIFYGNHFQKIRTDLLLRIDTQSTCLFPQYDSWQRKRRLLESSPLRAARAFFNPLREMTEKTCTFLNTFSNWHTTLRTSSFFLVPAQKNFGVCGSEPHNGLQNTGRSTCSDQVHWRGRPQPEAAQKSDESTRNELGRWTGTRIGQWRC